MRWFKYKHIKEIPKEPVIKKIYEFTISEKEIIMTDNFYLVNSSLAKENENLRNILRDLSDINTGLIPSENVKGDLLKNNPTEKLLPSMSGNVNEYSNIVNAIRQELDVLRSTLGFNDKKVPNENARTT